MKRVVFYKKEELEALKFTAKCMDFGVSLLVYASLNELLNAYITIREDKKLFKHEIKHLANEALRRKKEKEAELKAIMSNKGFAEAFWDSIIDECEKDVISFREKVTKVLADAGINNAKLIGEVETARVLLGAASLHYETVIEDVSKKFGVRSFKEEFKEFYVENVRKTWESLCDILYHTKGITVDLNSDETTEAFNALCDKFAKGEYIDSCIKTARKEYPDYEGENVIIKDKK